MPGKPPAIFSTVWKPNDPIIRHAITPSGKAGLTLIEVMLAITILSVGAAVLLTATARCMAIATKARHYSTAHRLIQRVNTENPLTRGELEAGVESGTFDEDGYRWEREIIENENEDREGLYTVRTRVSWSMSGRDAFEESVAYLYVQPEEEATPIGRRR
ncbi:MAG TPA: prepilin-type N-terminal cleavage/methylation domain-containing protein [Tichowtungia sp.]|nr:prepilin-type N-terminal cleavage/methylation domain-containing protein [Tichowtungia sp.]